VHILSCTNCLFKYYSTIVNPLPNAQVCVFDGTDDKITTTNYISKTSLYTTLLGSFWGNLFSLFQPEIYFKYYSIGLISRAENRSKN